MSQYYQIILALVLASALTACGGGGSSDSSDLNTITENLQTELSTNTASINTSPESAQSPDNIPDNIEAGNTEEQNTELEEQNTENNNTPTLAGAENPSMGLTPVVISASSETTTETSPTPTPAAAPTATPTPTPAAAPTATPTPTPSASLALYSYTNDINTAVPLAGAVLNQQMVYIFWQGSDIANVIYYCCKGVAGNANGEAHNASVTANNSPFGFAIDMAQFTTSGTRELYVDYATNDGDFHTDNLTNFSVNIVEPDPTYSVNATINWDAPAQREDGEALLTGEISSYEITYSDPNGDIATEQISADLTSWSTALNEGNYNFAIATIDSQGLSSQLSESIDCNISNSGSSCQ